MHAVSCLNKVVDISNLLRTLDINTRTVNRQNSVRTDRTRLRPSDYPNLRWTLNTNTWIVNKPIWLKTQWLPPTSCWYSYMHVNNCDYPNLRQTLNTNTWIVNKRTWWKTRWLPPTSCQYSCMYVDRLWLCKAVSTRARSMRGCSGSVSFP